MSTDFALRKYETLTVIRTRKQKCLYRVYLKRMDKLKSTFSHIKTNKNVHVNILRNF